jgi:hypothetical protein
VTDDPSRQSVDAPAGSGPVVDAHRKHPCAACGAQAEWNPARAALVCSFCGTVAPFAVGAGGEMLELDLVTALRELPDESRGWLADTRSVQCQSCRAVTVFDRARVGQNCDFCGSPKLVPYEEIRAPLRPQSLLPFKVSESEVRERIRRWYASRWFAPNALGRRALVDRVHGVYIPYWTFDAHVVCPWRAEAGHYYYTTETYRDNQGRRQTRQVRHVRWQPAAGEIRHFFDDEPVPGTHGVAAHLLRQIEPFPTVELVPYDTAYLSGFVVEHYQVVLFEAAERSRAQMRQKLQAMCAAAVPGDTYRNLEIRPVYSGETFKHILVPVWLLSYVFRGRPWQVVANGYTGVMAGDYPKSPWKIAGLVAAILMAVLILVLLSD